MSEKINVRWVVAHEPIDLFLRSANTFATIVSEMSNNRINVEILTKNEWEEKYNNNEKGRPFFALKNNDIQMGQYQTTFLGSVYKNYNILDMPFLFKDHDHVDRVLNGKIGDGLLKQLGKESPIIGLAFTYSGGFRIMINKEPITKFEELKGKNITCVPSPVLSEIFKSIGANPVHDNNWGNDEYLDIENFSVSEVDCSETTFVRYSKVKDKFPYIVDSKHSLFLTTIVMNKDFYGSLSDSDKEIFSIAAKKAAAYERKQTIEDSEEFKNNHKNLCGGLYEFSNDDIEKFKLATRSLYNSDFAKESFTPGLLKRIETT
ncbi:MAG: TRAP transporter substrate-binding protein [Gammaproteobacteria bacterium]|nr:TRAP transporter substrate-binding protein [Gammaproteobacteria bacterium]